MNAVSRPIFKWILSWRAPQSENDYIEFLIKKIRYDAYIYRDFKDLLSREDRKHPAIISIWRPVKSGQLLYLGKNLKPTDEELKEKEAIVWLLSRGVAEPITAIDSHEVQWYFLSQFGQKIKKRYQQIYGPK